MNYAGVKRTPAHLWIVGLLSLLWNGFGAYDYLMSVTRNEAYLANFPPEIVAFLDSFPAWANAAWAIGVWGSVLGSVLLLLRSRHAASAFILSLIGAAASFAFQLSIEIPAPLAGPAAWLIPLAILCGIVLQWLYSRAMAKRGVLR